MVIVAGTIASASPHIVSVLSGSQSRVDASPSESPEPSESPSVEPSESPEPSETPPPDPGEEEGSDPTEPKGPDFSACAGLTGLENAICRHEALLQLKPENTGLQNSLTHLQANLAKQQEKAALKQSGESHGQSGESHGPPVARPWPAGR